jgi:hypothetical protein
MGFSHAPRLSLFSKVPYLLIAGIALFTHHKYRKRLESDVALDAHGQPLDPDDEAVLGEEGIALRDQYGPTSGGYTDHGTAVVGAQRCL